MKSPVSDQTLPIIPKDEMPRSIQEYVDKISGNGEKLQVAVFRVAPH